MFCDILNEHYIVLLRGEKRHIGLPDPCRNLNFKETKHMKKFSRILSVLCILCLLLSIAVIPAAGVSASSSITRTLRIRNMWNSSYMTNDNGTGKYTSSDCGNSTVWTITFAPTTYTTIQNLDGTYLRAVNGGVTCEPLVENDSSFLWNVASTNSGRVRFLSASQPGKAINIENLTGSLQLTNYYDTWESAQWILEDEPTAIGNDTVMFQSADPNAAYEGQPSYLYDGAYANAMNFIGAGIHRGNYSYRIIDKGDYCYIQYCPQKDGASSYLKVEGASEATPWVSSDTALDETNPDFRWIIQENSDGTVSIVSVSAPGMCITNLGSTSLASMETAGISGKWNMRPANSLIVRIKTSYGDNFLAASTYDNKAYFSTSASATDKTTQWQVIYSGTQVYLKNMYNGKYLKAPSAEGDSQIYVASYAAADDSLYRWDCNSERYYISFDNQNHYLYPDETTTPYGATTSNTSGSPFWMYMDFSVVGFAQ